MTSSIAILIVVGILFLLLVPAWLYATRFVKTGPNEALIISGRRQRVWDPHAGKFRAVGFRVVRGGGTFVFPVIERCDRLSLELMTMEISTPEIPTVNGIRVTVDGLAQAKIDAEDGSIQTAAEMFLSKSPAEIKDVISEVLHGALRAVAGQRAIEQIHSDRERFAQEVLAAAETDLAKMGLRIVTFAVREVRDLQGYLEALARPRIEQIKRDGLLAEAEANRDVAIRMAEAEKEKNRSRLAAEVEIQRQQAEYEMKRAEYQAMVLKKRRELGLGPRCACGAENLPDSKFCSQCAKPV